MRLINLITQKFHSYPCTQEKQVQISTKETTNKKQQEGKKQVQEGLWWLYLIVQNWEQPE